MRRLLSLRCSTESPSGRRGRQPAAARGLRTRGLGAQHRRASARAFSQWEFSVRAVTSRRGFATPFRARLEQADSPRRRRASGPRSRSARPLGVRSGSQWEISVRARVSRRGFATPVCVRLERGGVDPGREADDDVRRKRVPASGVQAGPDRESAGPVSVRNRSRAAAPPAEESQVPMPVPASDAAPGREKPVRHAPTAWTP